MNRYEIALGKIPPPPPEFRELLPTEHQPDELDLQQATYFIGQPVEILMMWKRTGDPRWAQYLQAQEYVAGLPL